MNLRHYKNPVPDTPLHRHLEALLRENGGQLSTLAVCEQVLLMPRTDAEVARALVGALAEEDPRLRATDGIVGGVEPGAHEGWARAPPPGGRGRGWGRWRKKTRGCAPPTALSSGSSRPPRRPGAPPGASP